MMKHITFIFLMLFNTSILFCKEITYKVFKDYFNSKDKSYKFNASNPLFVDKFYVKDIRKLKNKIIKETYETYNIGEDGVKSYSDSYVRDVMYTYYFFDANGVITDVYFIDIMDTGYILRKNHRIFNCTQSEYEIIETGEKLNQKINNVYKAKITKDNDKLILNFDKRYNLAEKIVFSKNRITKSYTSGERMKSDDIFDYQINDNRIYYKDFTVENGIEDIFRTMKYEKCCLIEEERYLPSGNEIQKYENTGKDTGILVNEGQVSQIVQKYIRKFNPIGFLEYEKLKPYDGEKGDYSIRKREVLSKPDEFFNAHF